MGKYVNNSDSFRHNETEMELIIPLLETLPDFTSETDKLHHYRKINCLTQQQMADKLGIHRSTYNKLEKGKIKKPDKLSDKYDNLPNYI